jgi:hypothetical protein
MRLLACSMVLAIGCGGGGPARLVAPAAPPSLRTTDGLLVVASEADRATFRYCRDATGECAVVGPTPTGGTTMVYALEAGRWCLTHVACEPAAGDLAEHDVPDGEVLCIEVTAQQVSYPGHVHFDRSIEADLPCAGRATFLMHPDIDAELASAHPGLRSPRITLTPPAPIHASH